MAGAISIIRCGGGPLILRQMGWLLVETYSGKRSKSGWRSV